MPTTLSKSSNPDSDKQPAISVVIPAYNAENCLDGAVASAVDQTFDDIEIIIVNDGSTDQSLQKANAWQRQDSRVRVVDNESNLGVAQTRNKGIAAARSHLIALLDADDVWLPEKLATQYTFHLKYKSALICTGFWYKDKQVLPPAVVNYHTLLTNNVINTSSTLIDTKQVLLKFQHLQTCEDYAQWLTIARDHTIHSIREPLLTRNKQSGLSRNKLAMAKQRWDIYRQHEKLPLMLAVYYFCRYAVSGTKKQW